MHELLKELTAALEQKRSCVYCSVVETRGSTPQKAGAAMLVFPDGSQRGTLGGGCVEAEVKQRALRVLADADRAEVLTFCLDDNYGWDDGLICGGRMSILADPLRPRRRERSIADYYARLLELVEAGQGCTEAVVISAERSGPPVGRPLSFRRRRSRSVRRPGRMTDRLRRTVKLAEVACQPPSRSGRGPASGTASPICRSCRASRC